VKGIEVWRKSSKSVVKWSEVKCGEVRWNGAVGNLNGVKPNERAVKCSGVKFTWGKKWSVDKWSEGLSNRVSNFIRIDRSYEVCCLYGSFAYHMFFISFWFHFVSFMYGCMFYMLLFNFLNYVFLLLCLCILIVMYVPFWVLYLIVLLCILFV